MPSQPPASASEGTVDPAAEQSVEVEVQARRGEFAQGISRYLVRVCVAVSIALVVVWLLPPHYPQILIYAVLNLLLALAAGLFPVLQRRNRTAVGLFFVFGVSLVIVLCGPLLLPSLMPAVGIWDVIAMMVAILLLDDRRSRGLVGAFTLAYMVDVVAVAILGWSLFPPMEHRIELWVSGAVSLGIMLAAILIIRRIVLGLGRQFRRAQRLNFDLERQNHQMNETQAALTEERNLLRTLIDQLPDYIFVKDADRRFVNSNAAHNRVAGVKDAADLFGKSAFDVFPQSLAAQFEADDQQVLQSGQALVNVERTSVDAEGRERTVLTTKVPLHDASGRVTGLVGISRDITEHKRAEQQAVVLAAERQRGKLLREFITDVSHDFRTPLSIIGTSAFLVSKTTDPTKLTHYSQHIEEQIARLILLMDNFIELAHVEQDTASLQFQPTDLNSVLTTLLEQNQHEVREKRQQIEYHCETDSALVFGNLTALSKAIGNVVLNAIHYTPAEGTITLRLFRDGDNAVVEVADTGIGIQAADLPHIFDSFYRVDSARSMQSGGAGLGLSIAKKIVELLKGHIEVESEFGTGSVFQIYLPIYQ